MYAPKNAQAGSLTHAYIFKQNEKKNDTECNKTKKSTAYSMVCELVTNLRTRTVYSTTQNTPPPPDTIARLCRRKQFNNLTIIQFYTQKKAIY